MFVEERRIKKLKSWISSSVFFIFLYVFACFFYCCCCCFLWLYFVCVLIKVCIDQLVDKIIGILFLYKLEMQVHKVIKRKRMMEFNAARGKGPQIHATLSSQTTWHLRYRQASPEKVGMITQFQQYQSINNKHFVSIQLNTW